MKSNGKCACWLASRKTIWWPRSLVCYSEDVKRQVALHRSTIPRVTVLNNRKKYTMNILPERVFRCFIGFFYSFVFFWLKVVVKFLLKEDTSRIIFSVGWPVWHSFFCAKENVEIFLHYIIVAPPTGFDFRQYISCVTPPSPGSTAGNQSIFS